MKQVTKKNKQTEVGVIPSDWEVKELGSISTVSSGGTPNRGVASYWNGNIPWITTSQIDFNTIEQANEFITDEGLNNSAAKIYKAGTLLMAMYGQGKTRGKVAILGIDATTNQACGAITLAKDILKEYIFCNLSGRYDEIRNLSNTGNQENLNGELIKKILIPLPPTKAEQTAIATTLSDADALISSLEKLITKKRSIKQGTMQNLLQPKEGWEVKKLGDIFTFYSTANYSKAEMDLDGEIGCMHYGLIHAITNTIYSLKNGVMYYVKGNATEYEMIKDGDIIMVDASEDYEGINKSVEVFGVGNNKFIAGLHTYLMRDENSMLVNNFRGLVLNSNIVKYQLLKLAVGMKVYGVSKSQLKEILISIPSKEEQTRIATTLSDMDAEINALESKLEKYRKVKLGMMQNLLTGKIRLV